MLRALCAAAAAAAAISPTSSDTSGLREAFDLLFYLTAKTPHYV